jgi:hypothetical protein
VFHSYCGLFSTKLCFKETREHQISIFLQPLAVCATHRSLRKSNLDIFCSVCMQSLSTVQKTNLKENIPANAPTFPFCFLCSLFCCQWRHAECNSNRLTVFRNTQFRSVSQQNSAISEYHIGRYKSGSGFVY